MKKHDELSDLKVLRSVAKSVVLAAQKNHLTHKRMIAVRKSLREAITDNKAKAAELQKLKAAQEASEAERDKLAERLAWVDEDKQRALQKTKARYIDELRKLRDAHKAELDKEVDVAEDRSYAEGERTYERQVQGTKDIFFQCGWKAAMEKLGLGPDAEVFQNPPATFIPAHMQAYASAMQKRLIKEAKQEAEAEATAAQPTEQIPPEASEGAKDQETEQEVVAVVDATVDEVTEGLVEQTVDIDLH
ncbi:hypothetical protein CsSME_00053444 [Camellia sinensis var. sinensis]